MTDYTCRQNLGAGQETLYPRDILRTQSSPLQSSGLPAIYVKTPLSGMPSHTIFQLSDSEVSWRTHPSHSIQLPQICYTSCILLCRLALERPAWSPQTHALWPARFKVRLVAGPGLYALPCKHLISYHHILVLSVVPRCMPWRSEHGLTTELLSLSAPC